MKPKAYLLVFDGLADWEPAHALCEVNKSRKFDVMTAGFSDKPVTTMGGLKLKPEVTVRDIGRAETAILILPGGEIWEQRTDETLWPLLHRLHEKHVPIAAICGATLEIARAGLTHRVRHTSNSKEFLKALVPGYKDEAFYVDELAVADKNIITASGLGSLEFGREVIRQLGLSSDVETQAWFEMFKHGVIPASMAPRRREHDLAG